MGSEKQPYPDSFTVYGASLTTIWLQEHILMTVNRVFIAQKKTSFWFLKIFVQIENDFLDKVGDVGFLRATNEYFPIVSESLWGFFGP